ncbi:MAG TPA: ATP-binding protein, partial [Polyangiaceae bacterium]|nr:ATP-binding protein [Polyangiaceae bacterium]
LLAKADQALVQIVLENLLGNCWKFTGKVAAPKIEVGAAPGGNTFFVRDNGAGFDPAYAAKLFAPFQRLHSDKEFPGTGIGLATVNRIVDRHGGRIWAEGAVGQGATFYFTLPNQEQGVL